jgi:hypothetical protein
MRTRAIGTARAALLTAGFVALGVSAISPASAFADTNGDNSVLGGNQVSAPISAPINACGNSLALFGTSDASCKGGAEVKNGSGGGNTTSGKNSVGGGNQISAPVSAPIDACGNAVAVFGSSQAGCKGGATVKNGSGGGGDRTSGEGSVGGGNQLFAPVSAPVDVCGNAAAVFGDAVAACKGGATVKNGGNGYGGGQQTSGKHSVLGGNQATAPVSAPVDICGNAGGNALASCEGGATVANGGSGGNTTSGRHSVLGGNQADAPVSAPAEVCGNAAAVAGDAAAFCEGGAKTGANGGNTTSGNSSVGGGNQITAPVKAPVDVCGNAAAVLGDAAAGCQGGEGGGYYGSHMSKAVGAPVAMGLPTVPGITKALPMNPAGALPALPEAPVQAPQLPVGAPQLPVQAPVAKQEQRAAAAPADTLPVPVDAPDLPVQLPAGDLPIQPPAGLPAGLPQLPAGVPVQAPAALPQLPVDPQHLVGQLPVQPPVAMPVHAAAVPGVPAPAVPALPGSAGDLVDALAGALPAAPAAPALPALPTVPGPVTAQQAAPVPAPAPLALPDLPELPVISDIDLPMAPQEIAPAAANEAMSSGMQHSLYVLAVGALLAASSAVLGIARRIRFGRR